MRAGGVSAKRGSLETATILAPFGLAQRMRWDGAVGVRLAISPRQAIASLPA